MDSLRGAGQQRDTLWVRAPPAHRPVERGNPSSSHLAGRRRGARGGGTRLMHGCAPSFTGKRHLSFTRAKAHPVAHPLVVAPAGEGSQILNQLTHSWVEFCPK